MLVTGCRREKQINLDTLEPIVKNEECSFLDSKVALNSIKSNSIYTCSQVLQDFFEAMEVPAVVRPPYSFIEKRLAGVFFMSSGGGVKTLVFCDLRSDFKIDDLKAFLRTHVKTIYSAFLTPDKKHTDKYLAFVRVNEDSFIPETDAFKWREVTTKRHERKETKKVSVVIDKKAEVFVRNLPPDATAKEIKTHFEANAFPVRRVLIVKDPGTGMSRGSAFVEFESEEIAKAVLAQEPHEEDPRLTALSKRIAGLEQIRSVITTTDESSLFSFRKGERTLLISGVLSEEELKQRKTPVVEDRRNVSLLEECIPVNAAWREEQSRLVEASKRRLAHDGNLIVSKTRISLRRLGKGVDEKRLKQMIKQLFGGASVRIRQAKIVRDGERSKGFGFGDFERHEDALVFVRHLMKLAKPEPFFKKFGLGLPCIEFAIDRANVLHRMSQRKNLIGQNRE